MSTRGEWLALRKHLEDTDAELAAAIADVDVDYTLIESWLRMDPWERVVRCFDAAQAIEELRTWQRLD